MRRSSCTTAPKREERGNHQEEQLATEHSRDLPEQELWDLRIDDELDIDIEHEAQTSMFARQASVAKAQINTATAVGFTPDEDQQRISSFYLHT